MGTNPNTQTLLEVWQDQYQLSHYKQPVFRVIAEEKMLEGKLSKGATIHWSYMSDFYVEDMGADGSYNTQAQTDTDETLVINQVKDTSFYEFEKDLEQAHYQVKVKYAQKAMNKVFLQIDADVLYAAYAGAANVLDSGVLAGGAANGTPIVLSTANAPVIFWVADQILTLTNVIYDPNLTFTKEVKLEKVTGMPVAIISAQLKTNLLQFLGGKTTVLGDKVSVSGHAGAYAGFNIFVSNQLTSTMAITLAATPTTGDTFTINGLTFTFVTGSLGTTAGNILVTSAADAKTNLIAALAAPFTTTATYYTQVDNITNRLKLANLSCATFSGNISTIAQKGIGSMVVTVGAMNASNTIGGAGASGTATVTQHCIFGVSKSVGLAIQKYPTLYINPVSNKIGKDYVTWCYYGIKVFKYMTTQLIDVKIDASSFSQPTVITN